MGILKGQLKFTLGSQCSKVPDTALRTLPYSAIAPVRYPWNAKVALSSATQHEMPPKLGRKWGTECLNTRFLLPTLLCAGYSVKLIFNITL